MVLYVPDAAPSSRDENPLSRKTCICRHSSLMIG